MIERKIDTIITDQYGNANYTYTGGGKGERDIVMKCGKVVSQPYTVYDCVWYDDGLSSVTLTNIYSKSSNAELTTTSSGRTMGGAIYNTVSVKSNNSINIPVNNGICAEFEIVAISPRIRFRFYQASPQSYSRQILNATGKYRITCDGTTCIWYKQTNGEFVEFARETVNVSTVQMTFESVDADFSLTFKDFKVYPI